MALARMYCGVAAAEMPSWLTVAVVDDAGRLLDVRHLSDDPAGYAHLGALLGDRAGGSPVAVDRPDHLVTQLLAAANRPLAIADPAVAADFADRFCDETSYDEMRAPPGQRCAVGLARALQAGAVYVTAQSPSVEFEEFKPILAAHAAVIAGRQAAAVALREVLRELYPAALRAYPDPADYVPLRILEALPEPGLLAGSMPGRESALAAELAASGVVDPAAAINALRVAVSESPRRHDNRQFAPVVGETVRQAVAAVRACDAAVGALVTSMCQRLAAITTAPRTARPYLVPAAPVSPAPRRAGGPVTDGPADRIPRRPDLAPAYPGGLGHGPGTERTMPAAYADPLTAPFPPAPPQTAPLPRASQERTTPARPVPERPGPTRPAPPWRSDDLPEPPALRLVASRPADPLTDPLPEALAPPVLRVIEGARSARTDSGADAPPEPDGDLLIFSQAARSAWFTQVDEAAPESDPASWGRLADDGWRAAEQLARPAVGAQTTAGLPRRVPQANLVPGSAPAPPRQVRIVRDARSIAAHTDGYFRGWRRGQQIGGFAVGQRDRAAWEFNRDQRARDDVDQRARLS